MKRTSTEVAPAAEGVVQQTIPSETEGGKWMTNIRWPEINGRRLFAQLRHWSWIIFGKGLGGILFTAPVAEGVRVMISTMSEKLHRSMFFGFMKNYEGTYRIDRADLTAWVVVLGVWYLWGRILRAWISSNGCEGWWKETPHIRVITILGMVILSVDAITFYRGIVQMQWGTATFSFTAAVATVMYCALMLLFAFIGVNLQMALKEKNGD